MQSSTTFSRRSALSSAGLGLLPGLQAQRSSASNRLGALSVHSGGHLLQSADGQPFFWMADTAWELIHRTTREECSYYLKTRAQQYYSVIQAVVLAEFEGVTAPNALGETPFTGNDPSRPNEAYFDRVVEIVDEAAARGLYVALLPTWGDKLTAPWGAGPRLFTLDNLPVARAYGRYLAGKVNDRSNVVWMLGGDRPARIDPTAGGNRQNAATRSGFPPNQDWTPIWREMAAGLAEGGSKRLTLYHPQSGKNSTSVYLHNEAWLDVNGMQSGHGGGHDVPVWEWVARDYAIKPAKPTVDLEPNYEDHPFNPWPRWDPSTGYYRDHDVRKQVYRSVFAGGCGVTYGHHAIWGFVGTRNDVINHADRDWIDALSRPAGRQMRFLRELIESRPFFTRIPDQSLIVGEAGVGSMHLQGTRDTEGTYAFLYFPMNDQPAQVDLSKLKAKRVRAWWYDPRIGFGRLIGVMDGAAQKEFKSPPFGPDWVLVLDDADAKYPSPGLRSLAT